MSCQWPRTERGPEALLQNGGHTGQVHESDGPDKLQQEAPGEAKVANNTS